VLLLFFKSKEFETIVQQKITILLVIVIILAPLIFDPKEYISRLRVFKLFNDSIREFSLTKLFKSLVFWKKMASLLFVVFQDLEMALKMPLHE